MYPVTAATFPTLGAIAVPRYEIEAFDGKTLYLSLELPMFTVDISQLDASVIMEAVQDVGDQFELRGLLAVDSDLVMGAINSGAKESPLQAVGTVLEGTWYAIRPLDSRTAPRAGTYIVVGLYR